MPLEVSLTLISPPSPALSHGVVCLGIGAACAIALAEAGAAICLVLREPKDDTPPNLTTVDAIRNIGATAHFIHCDLDNLDSVKGVFQKALDAMGGRIDVLVNCAGIQRRSPSLDFSETDWDDVRSRCFCSVLCSSHYGTIASFSLCVTPVFLHILYLFTLFLLHRF